MSDTIESLILDLLEWIGPDSRPYVEVMEAWRTSCPRLPVWEDANDRGFIERQHEPGRGELISVSPAGARHLRRPRPRAAARHDRPRLRRRTAPIRTLAGSGAAVVDFVHTESARTGGIPWKT